MASRSSGAGAGGGQGGSYAIVAAGNKRGAGDASRGEQLASKTQRAEAFGGDDAVSAMDLTNDGAVRLLSTEEEEDDVNNSRMLPGAESGKPQGKSEAPKKNFSWLQVSIEQDSREEVQETDVTDAITLMLMDMRSEEREGGAIDVPASPQKLIQC